VQLGGEDFGWRLVFLVNLPIGVLLLVLARKWLPVAAEGRRQSLDPVGVLLFAAGTVLVLLPVVEGERGQSLAERPWWLLGVAAVVFVTFYFWERWWTRRRKETLIDLSLTKVRSFVFGVGLGSFYFAGFTSIFLILTLYLQNGLGYTALQAGLTQMPFAVGSAVAAFVAGRIVERFGRSLVVAGLVAVIVALVAIDIMVPRLDGDVGLKLAPLLLLAGAGGGLVIAPNITLALDEVDPVRAGAGGGLLQTFQRVGSAIGVAVVLAQFFDRLATSHGDSAEAFTVALHTTIGLIVAALVLGLADLRRRREHSQQRR
jgi:predicted MFS family arabinose efflux permease